MISITIGNSQGSIDQTQFSAALKETSRLITFQDGLARHITLRDAYWSTADRLQNGEGWPSRILPGIAWSTALLTCQPGSTAFEEKLRVAYETVLVLAVTKQPVANSF